MASNAVRKFEDYEASTVVKPMPLIVGITAPQGAGKTFSALRLAAGMQRVVGGEVFGIDTESDRMLHYKDRFKFRHVPFAPPHGPADYEAAIDYCLGRGARIIVIDSMTHEHSGEGGVLDQVDEFLQRKAGEDWEKRDRLKWTAQIVPKAQRRRLNRHIVAVGARCFFILCYRAEDKTKPVAGGKPVHLGWQAETTSKLPFEMTVRFLLPPASDGVPNLTPDTEFEKLAIKNPGQFRDWFRPGLQLNEDLGERLARWAAGGATTAPAPEREPGEDDAPAAAADALQEELEAKLAAIAAELQKRNPGDNDAAKKARGEDAFRFFKVRGWSKLQQLSLDALAEGLERLRAS